MPGRLARFGCSRDRISRVSRTKKRMRYGYAGSGVARLYFFSCSCTQHGTGRPVAPWMRMRLVQPCPCAMVQPRARRTSQGQAGPGAQRTSAAVVHGACTASSLAGTTYHLGRSRRRIRNSYTFNFTTPYLIAATGVTRRTAAPHRLKQARCSARWSERSDAA